jgi:hypothetical protein
MVHRIDFILRIEIKYFVITLISLYRWENMQYRVAEIEKLNREAELGNAQALKNKQKSEEDSAIRQRMGFVRYTFMPWERPKAKAQLERLKRMEEEIESKYSKDEQIKSTSSREQNVNIRSTKTLPIEGDYPVER